MRKALAINLGLALAVAVDAVYQIGVLPYVAIAYLFAITILIISGRIQKHIPIYIFGIALALLWATSMQGTYVVGTDIHTELYATNSVIANGWDMTKTDGNNSSFTLVLLAPLLDKLGFDVVWQFKMLYPLFFAFTPVFLYLAYKTLFGTKRAYLATIFLIIMPMFVLDMTSHVKGMVSQPFLAAAIYLFVADMRWRVKLPLFFVCIVGASVNHYAVGMWTTIYMVGTFGLILLVQIKRKVFNHETIKKRAYILAVGSIAVVSIITMYGWYSVVGGGSFLRYVTAIGKNIVEVTSKTSNTDTELQTQYKLYTSSVVNVNIKTGTYLDNQEQLVKTALGLDFMSATTGGKAFRIFQYITQLFIIIGVGAIFWRYKKEKIPLAYKSLVFISIMILFACLFVPFFTTIGSATRTYQITLYALAPAFIIGAEQLRIIKWLKGKTLWIATTIILVYALFTTGFVLEASKSTVTDRVDMPYSVSLSNDRLNIAGIFTPDDIKVAEWLSYNGDSDIPLYSDYNGTCLMLGLAPWWTVRQTDIPIDKDCYVFLTGWSVENDTLVYGGMPGLRISKELPDINMDTLYQKGDAVAMRSSN